MLRICITVNCRTIRLGDHLSFSVTSRPVLLSLVGAPFVISAVLYGVAGVNEGTGCTRRPSAFSFRMAAVILRAAGVNKDCGDCQGTSRLQQMFAIVMSTVTSEQNVESMVVPVTIIRKSEGHPNGHERIDTTLTRSRRSRHACVASEGKSAGFTHTCVLTAVTNFFGPARVHDTAGNRQ